MAIPRSNAPETHSVARSAHARATEPGGTIVVADDTVASAANLARLLGRDGHRMHRVRDGQEALDAVSQHQPDVVLLDAMMPRLSGFDICAALKSNCASRFIPVVLITALHAPQGRIRGIEARDASTEYRSSPS